MNKAPLSIAKAALQAYVDKDRELIESLIDEQFHFTSPLDNAIDRQTYFARCWPNSETMSAAEVVLGTETGDTAFLTYEASTTTGKRFRNTEVHTVRDGKLISVEVYFGWTVPHRAAKGHFVENSG